MEARNSKKILIVNDDGILAGGLRELALAVQKICPIAICAPFKEQSACGTGMTLSKPLGAKQVQNVHLPVEAWAVDGRPMDAAAFAIGHAYQDNIQMVLSGVNNGFNTGDDVLISGTVSAALYAYTHHSLPSIAVSIEHRNNQAEPYAARIAALFAAEILNGSLPQDIFLNINYPTVSLNELKGIKVVPMGRHTHEDFISVVELHGRPFYWMGREEKASDGEKWTDVRAVRNGYISVCVLSEELFKNPAPADIVTVANRVYDTFSKETINKI